MKTEQRSATSGQRKFMICDVCHEVVPKAEGILVSLERFRQLQHAPNSKLTPAVVGKSGGRTSYFRWHIEALLLDSFASLRAFGDDKEAA
jgi:hypothetical protein